MASSARDKERERARYAALTPEEKRAKGLAANARKRAEVLALRDENARLWREVHQLYRSRYGEDPVLPVVPFRMWLLAVHKELGSTQAIATAVGADEKQVRRYLDGFEWQQCGPVAVHGVTATVVDAWCTALGGRLDDLYDHVLGWPDA